MPLKPSGTDSNAIASNLQQVQSRIAEVCSDAGRSPQAVSLLAVSKTKPVAAVRAAMNAGQTHFGENYLQDALEKIEEIGQGPTWHFIGAIQSNKTRQIAEHFHWVHTVSSLKVARRLNDQRPKHLAPLKFFIQVNVDLDPDKSGVTPDDLSQLIDQIGEFKQLELKGLMTLPAQTDTLDSQRKPFRELNKLRNQHLPGALDLSMGMSGDLEAAIMEGATWVRIGTDIFGTRERP